MDRIDQIGPNVTKVDRSTQQKYKRNMFVVINFGLKINKIKYL